jgi:CSLREA domain-containing protein
MSARRHPLFIAVTRGLLLGVATTALAGDPVQPGPDFIVNSAGDDGDSVCEAVVGTCTLRDAVLAANSDPDLSVISFDSALFGAPTTITLSQGDMVVTESTTIAGPGAGLLTIDAADQSRHFHFADPANPLAELLTVNRVSGLTLVNGNDFIGSSEPTGRGGSIRTAANLTLDSIQILDSRSRAGGGLLARNADVTIVNSTLSGNRSANWGGCIYSRNNFLTVSNTTITGCSVQNAGVGTGLAIELDVASLDLVDSTVSKGGDLVAGGAGASIAFQDANADSSVRIVRSIVGAGGDTDLSGGGRFELDHALVQNPGEVNITSINASLTGIDPRLGELADNGGTTPTQILLPGSPAIDAAGNGCPVTDQRGQLRPADGDLDGQALCDMGAFELQREEIQDILFSNRLEG